MTKIIIDNGTTRRRRSNRYPGVFGTIFEFFSVCLSAVRLFKRAGRFCKKATAGTDDTPPKSRKSSKSSKSTKAK